MAGKRTKNIRVIKTNGGADNFYTFYSLSDVRFPLEAYGLYYSVYRAVVKSVDEKTNMIKVSIPSLNISELPVSINYLVNSVRSIAGGRSKGKKIATFQVLPRKDDILLVTFEGGNLSHPIILGYLHPTEEADGEFLKDDNDKVYETFFRSRSGHLVVFDDTENSEKIMIENQDKSVKILIEKDHVNIKVKNFQVDIKGDDEIVIEGKKIKLWNKGSVEPAVLGNKLVSFLRELLQLLAQHTHPPNSPPAQASQFAQKIKALNDLLSKVNSIE